MRFTFPLTLLLALVPAMRAAEWEPIASEFVKAEKPGFGGLTGIVVDRQSGDLYVWISDRGMYKSTDQGKTFAPLGPRTKGRTEWPGCMLSDPADAKTWVIATVYGGPILSSTDNCETFTPMDKASQHVDWVAVDWGTRKFVLTLKHESGDLLLASADGGKSFREVGKAFGPACVFNEQTAVVVQIVPGKPKKPAKRVLARTTDGGKTFAKVADFVTKAVPVWEGKTPYWLVDGAIITSKDKGETWQQVCVVTNGQFGPVFGKDEKEMFVLTPQGVIATADGGATWSAPIAPPKEMKGLGVLAWIGFDAKHRQLYLMKMGSDLYRMKLPGA
jgi:photosystem II stability/assembly factor-like uncharacterized protein